jgi:transposase
MIQRGGEVVIRMLANVQQRTIKPLIQATIAPGTCVYTDEYAIYSRLEGCVPPFTHTVAQPREGLAL